MPSSFKNQTTITTTRRNKMKKVLLSLLTIALAFTAIAPAQAQDERVLAIIDSAINSNNFPSIIHEVCFTTVKSSVPAQNMSCPNGELFMEGKGAASAPWPKSINNATYHGDSMVKAALTVNPSLKIVFIRFNDVTVSGNSRGDVKALTSAIDWVSKNASKYSIDALSISQSSVSANNLALCSTSTVVINSFASLTSSNIPVFVATGNDRRRDVVGFPSCVNGAIGVGALGNATQLEAATNTGPGLDMVAPGKVRITKYNGSPTDTAGSSVATAVSAASYVNRNTFKTFGEYLTSLPKILIGNASYIRN
jgi:Subtilase family